ncbi:GAF and ANTAR domain-containing protein [Puerhibacterium sp. TATVAM-FAB25]|uniref:GAF and ANTAR domain-containing protein n=1 Tax=Puerhibacterium sp. TATVAM-FAB25 TaxID=3093699 RepID=UPI003979029F
MVAVEVVDDAVGNELAGVIAGRAGPALGEPACDALLELLTSTAAQAVPSASGAAVSLSQEGWRTATATGPLVRRVDTLQATLGEGPCHTAAAERRVVVAPDLHDEARWPHWAGAACRLGLTSTMSAPLVVGDDVVGALTLYARHPGALTDAASVVLSLFAAQAGVLVASAQAARGAERLPSRVQAALRTRDEVNVAVGLIMAEERVSRDAAFAYLTAMSQQARQPLGDTADRVVRKHEGRHRGRRGTGDGHRR